MRVSVSVCVLVCKGSMQPTQNTCLRARARACVCLNTCVHAFACVYTMTPRTEYMYTHTHAHTHRWILCLLCGLSWTTMGGAVDFGPEDDNLKSVVETGMRLRTGLLFFILGLFWHFCVSQRLQEPRSRFVLEFTMPVTWPFLQVSNTPDLNQTLN